MNLPLVVEASLITATYVGISLIVVWYVKKYRGDQFSASTAAALLLTGIAGAYLYALGHPLICKCNYVKLWHGVTFSSENSQHISDWYTFSHVIHGFAFYWLLSLFARRMPASRKLLIAIIIEAAWEIFENTDFVINRYREVTISLDYYGDSVLNSICDIGAMVLGFIMARKWPVWLIVALAIGMELFVGYMIRDNLTLNIIMLLYPNDAVLNWQSTPML